MARQQQLVVHERVGVVLAHVAGDEEVELAEHEAEEGKLVARVLQVDEDVAAQQGPAHSLVGEVVGDVEDGPEAGAEVGEGLGAGVDAVALAVLQDELQAVGDEGVGVVAGDDAGVDLAVGGALQRAEHDDNGDEELLLAHREPHHGVAVEKVVQVEGHGALVWLNAADGAGEVAERGAALGERRSLHRHDVVPPRELQHADGPLDPVAYKVAAELGRVLAASGQLPGRRVCVVAQRRPHHQGHLAHLHREAVHRPQARPARKIDKQGPRVRQPALAALGGQEAVVGVVALPLREPDRHARNPEPQLLPALGHFHLLRRDVPHRELQALVHHVVEGLDGRLQQPVQLLVRRIRHRPHRPARDMPVRGGRLDHSTGHARAHEHTSTRVHKSILAKSIFHFLPPHGAVAMRPPALSSRPRGWTVRWLHVMLAAAALATAEAAPRSASDLPSAPPPPSLTPPHPAAPAPDLSAVYEVKHIALAVPEGDSSLLQRVTAVVLRAELDGDLFLNNTAVLTATNRSARAFGPGPHRAPQAHPLPALTAALAPPRRPTPNYRGPERLPLRRRRLLPPSHHCSPGRQGGWHPRAAAEALCGPVADGAVLPPAPPRPRLRRTGYSLPYRHSSPSCASFGKPGSPPRCPCSAPPD